MAQFETLLTGLPKPAYLAEQVRQHEAQVAENAGIAMTQLMEMAGAASFACLRAHFPQATKLLLLCGKGNNGGDGLVLARLALAAGLQVHIMVLAQPAQIQGDALAALQRLPNKVQQQIQFVTEPQQLSQLLGQCEQLTYDVLVDALLGTGFHGRLSALFKLMIKFINASSSAKFSLDVPSGLCADTGYVEQLAVRADACISFIALKQGLLTGCAADHVGTLYLADLTIGQQFAEAVPSQVVVQGEHALPTLGRRAKTSHKGTHGTLLAIGGGKGMPGAIRLASEAALRCGAGLVAVSCDQDNQAMVINHRPELMLASFDLSTLARCAVFNKANAILVGPGLGRDQCAAKLVALALAQPKILILDADALFFLAQRPSQHAQLILTPHPGEAAMLLGCSITQIEQDRFAAVRAMANRYGAICVLKGAGSLISDGTQVFINTSGNAGMASGGMGDVLSGMIATLAMQMPLLDAVRLSVFLHGKAAQLVALQHGERGILASDLFLPIQQLVNQY